jgi:hypothetical protein
VAYCYDQALAISAFVARRRPDDLRRAKLIADAFVLLQKRDRGFTDGRIRNVACPGDLLEPTLDPNTQHARIPGRWDTTRQEWVEDEYFVGSDCGNTAWAILGLLNYWAAVGKPADSPHLAAAIQMARWVDTNAFSAASGFTGGVTGWEKDQRKLTWKSSEHAIDLYCAFARLADATGERRFRTCAEHAKKFIESMWSKSEGHLWTGTKVDGVTINKSPIPLDVQAWSLLALRDAKRYGPAVTWAARNCRASVAGSDRLLGYGFAAKQQGAWFEGTAQMAMAFQALGQHKDRDDCLAAIREYGSAAVPSGAIHAASEDELKTGFDGSWGGSWVYYRRPHLGATAWFMLASMGYNPYWGGPVTPAK